MAEILSDIKNLEVLSLKAITAHSPREHALAQDSFEVAVEMIGQEIEEYLYTIYTH